MKKKIVAVALAMTVSLTAMQVLRYDPVLADRIEEVTGEDNGGTDPEVETVEEAIGEDYGTDAVAIDETNFPDAVFRSWVTRYDADGDGVLSSGELETVTEMDVQCMGIASVQGIEFFTSLYVFRCSGNELTALDMSGNTDLRELYCNGNHLTALNVSNNTNLEDLFCDLNPLTELDVKNNRDLIRLDIDTTNIETVDLSGNHKLMHLYCDHSDLIELDISHNPMLEIVYCHDCPFTYLDISNNPNLLTAYYNTEFPHSGCYNIYLCSFGLIDYYLKCNDYVTINVSPSIPDTVNMYRLYNWNNGEHFYTSSLPERANLIRAGWMDEGIGWVAPRTSGTPVYRLYNQYGGEHHYTTSLSERNYLISLGWNDEGIGWYSDDQRRVPLYRQYNPNAYANNHNYTTSLSENNWLVSIGWRAEGIGWYGVGAGI